MTVDNHYGFLRESLATPSHVKRSQLWRFKTWGDKHSLQRYKIVIFFAFSFDT